MSDNDKSYTARGTEAGQRDPANIWIRVAHVPIMIGLSIAMILFVITFFLEIYHSIQAYEFLDRKKTILLILNLLDMVFIANLVIMVGSNTYNVYRLKDQEPGEDVLIQGEKAYRRMKHRIVSTIVIIASIHVLSELLEFSEMSAQRAITLIGLHAVLIVTYVVTNVFKPNE